MIPPGAEKAGNTMIKDDKHNLNPASEDHLPSRQTFLLRFSDATQPEAGIYQGRIEHISTGKAARFTTFPEIIKFSAEVIAADSKEI